ncbi:meiotic recombination protein REC114-like [Patiria miniata]|uniref:Meiotic recombination protein REC114 n=1 Tax=Patiria miniata TaxID=46514 RepID=A0A913ZJV7_PATMI|nr:meiotic recombination protein REC114-like [Patiria miniata]
MALNSKRSEWHLLRYARFVRSNDAAKTGGKEQQEASTQAGTWKHFPWSDAEPLMLSIQDSSYLLITRGKLILESHALFDAEHYIKGAVRGDCLLFIQKIKNECRKFRVKFKQGSFPSTVEACADCVVNLRTYFHVKQEGADTTQKPAADKTILEGEVSLGTVATVLLGSKTLDLPLAYHHHQSSWQPEQLSEMVRLCLADPTFPAFVETVEDELKKLTRDE